MPSEKFYPSYAVEGEDTEVLEVAWANPGEHYDGKSGKVFVMAYEKVFDQSEGKSLGRYNLLSFDLDRSGLNRLIRSLKRARNATYGADE